MYNSIVKIERWCDSMPEEENYVYIKELNAEMNKIIQDARKRVQQQCDEISSALELATDQFIEKSNAELNQYPNAEKSAKKNLNNQSIIEPIRVHDNNEDIEKFVNVANGPSETNTEKQLQQVFDTIEQQAERSIEDNVMANTQEIIKTNDNKESLESSVVSYDIEQINQETINEAEQESEYLDKEDSLDADAEQIVIDNQRPLTSQMMSIKKASVKNKRNKKKIDLKMVPYVAAVGAACLAFGITIAAPLVAKAINNATPDCIQQEIQNYHTNIFEPYTTKTVVVNKRIISDNEENENLEEEQKKQIVEISREIQDVHYHDMIGMLSRTKESYEDPIVGFYLLYQNLDQYCKNNKLTETIGNFNTIYGTKYKDIEDFLLKNGFTSMKELEKYAKDEIKKKDEEEENELNGGRNL